MNGIPAFAGMTAPRFSRGLGWRQATLRLQPILSSCAGFPASHGLRPQLMAEQPQHVVHLVHAQAGFAAFQLPQEAQPYPRPVGQGGLGESGLFSLSADEGVQGFHEDFQAVMLPDRVHANDAGGLSLCGV